MAQGIVRLIDHARMYLQAPLPARELEDTLQVDQVDAGGDAGDAPLLPDVVDNAFCGAGVGNDVFEKVL